MKTFALGSRRLLQVTGEDSAKFLQGLITQDIRHITPSSYHLPLSPLPLRATISSSLYHTSPCLYQSVSALFLNSKGRVCADTIIWNIEKETTNAPKYIIDVDSASIPFLKRFLFLHKLKSKVSIQPCPSNYCVLQSMPSLHSPLPQSENDIKASITEALRSIEEYTASAFQTIAPSSPISLTFDPRLWYMGLRSIVASPAAVVEEKDAEDYNDRRLLLGVSEGWRETATEWVDVSRREKGEKGMDREGEEREKEKKSGSIPFHNNFDWQRNFSTRKGCYIGQELCSRTFANGAVRKRLAVAVFSSPKEAGEQTVEGEETEKRGGEKGEEFSLKEDSLCSGVDATQYIGLELCSKSDRGKDLSLGKVLNASKNVGVVTFSWQRKDMKNPEDYLEIIRQLRKETLYVKVESGEEIPVQIHPSAIVGEMLSPENTKSSLALIHAPMD